ncbi:MAG: alpha-amylase [Actinobacteria bacterium]|nr:alpha-amylase [Actinomycetota bacterium]
MRFGSAVAAGAAAVLVSLAVSPAVADESLTSLAVPAVRSPISSDTFYFVMTDRYADGDPGNNTGGRTGPLETTGFEPASDAFYHGGDLAGLTGRCDASDPADEGLGRLKRLGFTAVWITPPFVQRTVQGSSAAYHGYWFLDITKPDPHVGTEADFAAFMGCAKKLGLKVFLDVVVNHTADVISYKEGNAYVPLAKAPYRTATGRPFNPWRFTAGSAFPRLAPRRSFAKTPRVDAPFASAKGPAVLNEVTRYHNRGDIAWGSCVGRCEMDGDFSGLDDLMTEDWTVVKALADAYGEWITKYGVDGFRIDTAKHVDPYFFGRWLPLVNQTAAAAGKPSFTSFGEAWLTDTAQLSELMLARQLPSVLDFPYQDTVRKFVSDQVTGRSLALLFDDDDYYTSASTNAYGLTTFLGNHDMGRIGFFLATGTSAEGPALLERDVLAHDVLYLTRGVPVVYYGDEVGMTGSGDGKDKNARQDMFPTEVAAWRTEERVGGAPIGSNSAFSRATPIEAHIGELARLRSENPALSSGPQITRYGDGSVFAASRIDVAARTEYLVAFNTADEAVSASIPTSTPSAAWSSLRGAGGAVTDAAGKMSLSVPARSSVVLKADSTLPSPGAPAVSVTAAQDAVTGRYKVSATVPGADPSSVTFVMRRKGAANWTVLGTDDARPFRVFVPPARRASAEIAAVVTDSVGQRASSPPITTGLSPFS